MFDIEKESVRRFAEAIGETNPLYYDASYAAQSPWKSLIAPPGYISALWYWGGGTEDEPGLMGVILAISDAGYTNAIDTGIDYEFMLPVRVGDTITSSCYVKDIVERGKGDERAVFLFSETVYTNQENETVARVRITTAHR